MSLFGVTPQGAQPSSLQQLLALIPQDGIKGGAMQQPVALPQGGAQAPGKSGGNSGGFDLGAAANQAGNLQTLPWLDGTGNAASWGSALGQAGGGAVGGAVGDGVGSALGQLASMFSSLFV